MSEKLIEILRQNEYHKPKEFSKKSHLNEIVTKQYDNLFVRHMPAHSKYGDTVCMVVFNNSSKQGEGLMYSIPYPDLVEMHESGLTPIVAEECNLQMDAKDFKKRFDY